MIPVGDDNTDRRSRPVVTWAIIALNVLVFVVFQGCGANDRFTYAWSTVPQEILTGRDLVTADQVVRDPATGRRYVEPGLGVTPISVYLTLLVSMFLHGSIAHIAGNMLYLFIFGDNVEDRIGRVRFLLFYLFCGVAASLAQVFVTTWTGQDLAVPSLGASGAISGVLGAYLLLFPRRRVRLLVFPLLIPVPAWIAVGIWFLYQIVGLGYLGGGTGGGVAYAAHVGGFVAGMATIKLWDHSGPSRGSRRAAEYGRRY
jgi:membrane associated rhomboid family serine protease